MGMLVETLERADAAWTRCFPIEQVGRGKATVREPLQALLLRHELCELNSRWLI